MFKFPYKISEESLTSYLSQYNVEEDDIVLYEKVDIDVYNQKRLATSAKIMEKLVEKYPKCSMFLNQLFSIHAMKQDQEKILFCAEQLWEKFPTDLMSMILKSHFLLFQEGVQPLDVLQQIFNGVTFLNDLYPERKEFYPHEVLHFHKLMMQLFARNNDFKTALRHALIVSKIDYEDQDCLELFTQILISGQHPCELMETKCTGETCQSLTVIKQIKTMLENEN